MIGSNTIYYDIPAGLSSDLAVGQAGALWGPSGPSCSGTPSAGRTPGAWVDAYEMI